MPSQLEGAMDALITVFYNYSGNDGDKFKLNKGELKELLNSELTDFLTVCLVFYMLHLTFLFRRWIVLNRVWEIKGFKNSLASDNHHPSYAESFTVVLMKRIKSNDKYI